MDPFTTEIKILQFLLDSNFAGEEGECVSSPENCAHGFSASLFYKFDYEVDVTDLESNFRKIFPREYILSTGK